MTAVADHLTPGPDDHQPTDLETRIDLFTVITAGLVVTATLAWIGAGCVANAVDGDGVVVAVGVAAALTVCTAVVATAAANRHYMRRVFVCNRSRGDTGLDSTWQAYLAGKLDRSE